MCGDFFINWWTIHITLLTVGMLQQMLDLACYICLYCAWYVYGCSSVAESAIFNAISIARWRNTKKYNEEFVWVLLINIPGTLHYCF